MRQSALAEAEKHYNDSIASARVQLEAAMAMEEVVIEASDAVGGAGIDSTSIDLRNLSASKQQQQVSMQSIMPPIDGGTCAIVTQMQFLKNIKS